MTRRVGAALLIVACVGATGACGSPPDNVPAPSRETLPDASLPDLSRMDAAVQAQFRQQAQALDALVANPASPRADLAAAYGELGRLLMAAEYFEAAEPYLRHAQANAPGDMRWPYYLGHVHMANAEPARARADFERVLQAQPDDAATLVWLANLHLDQGGPELAERLFARALETQPRMVAALFGLGRAALARRDFTRAADYLERALAADPRATVAHYPLGLAYRGLGDTARAEAHLRQRGGVEVGPPDPLLVELRGLLQGPVAEEARGVRALDAGDYPTAAVHFRKAVDQAPSNAGLRHKLGTALSLAGDTPGAVREFEAALRVSPGFPQAHYSLGVLLGASGRMPQATAHLAAAVQSQPDYVDARLRLAEALRQGGRMQESLSQYAAVLAIDPRVSDARFGHAATLAALGRLREAREAFSDAVRLHPEQPRFAEALARVESALAGRQQLAP